MKGNSQHYQSMLAIAARDGWQNEGCVKEGLSVEAVAKLIEGSEQDLVTYVKKITATKGANILYLIDDVDEKRGKQGHSIPIFIPEDPAHTTFSMHVVRWTYGVTQIA